MKRSGCLVHLGKYSILPPGIIFRVLLIGAMVLSALPVCGEDDLSSLFGPFLNQNYKATAVSESLTGRVGEQIKLSFTLDPPEEPVGSFLTVNLSEHKFPELVKKDQQPKVLTGFPDTSMFFSQPGIYQYSVVVSLIAKGSCAGVHADKVYKGVITVDVSP